VQAIELIIEVLVQGVLQKTGRRILARFGVKSNILVEFVLGFVVWCVILYALLVLSVFIVLLVKQF
jgi:hypothetical protein